ncbi:MAG TPA: type II toxin-antitoxin system HicB family antitoxin [Gemmataceae bacterium]|nr:type II toxin-antitoxin system HicB family antitoxin [Gemmataceae bacterium]
MAKRASSAGQASASTISDQVPGGTNKAAEQARRIWERLRATFEADAEGLTALLEHVAKSQGAKPARLPLRVKVVLYPEEEGGFTVAVPALPGCTTEGETREEALANIREALQAYLLSTSGAFEMEKDGLAEEIEL